MTRPLIVWTMVRSTFSDEIDARHSDGRPADQVRVTTASQTQAEAARRFGVSPLTFRNYATDTHNAEDAAWALDHPDRVVVFPLHPGDTLQGDCRPLVFTSVSKS